MTQAAKAKGILGAVIDGGCRDVAEHLERDYPVNDLYSTTRIALPRTLLRDQVFARTNSTLGTRINMRASEVDVPITVRPSPPNIPGTSVPYPDITIHPGDLIVCDMDGCVVPKESIGVVVQAARRRQKHGALVMDELAKGTGVKATEAKLEAYK
jgi:regulator of RNase E activity RraA